MSKQKTQNLPQDTLMDPMEETRVKMKFSKLVESLVPQLHFSYVEMERLLLIYYKLCKENNNKCMSSFQLRDILYKVFDMTEDYLMDRIMLKLKKGNNLFVVTFETFAGTLSLFLRGTLEEKIVFCFSIYDVQGDGILGKDTMMYLLKNSMYSTTSEEDAEEAVRDLIDILAKKMDLDRDGKISFKDYQTTVMQNPEMLESFGACLPDRLSINQFLTTFTQHTWYL